MIEAKIQIFIDGIINYFHETNDREVVVGSPYLIEADDDIATDYTGAIKISGLYAGNCYFSATDDLLRHLILQSGETDTSEVMMVDAVGEIANILTGTARKQLGEDFIISTPEVYIGRNISQTLMQTQRLYGIPLEWKSRSAILTMHLT